MVYIRWDQWTHTHTHKDTTEEKDGQHASGTPKKCPTRRGSCPVETRISPVKQHAVPWGLLQMQGQMRVVLHMGFPL